MKPMFRTTATALLVAMLAGTSLESQACGEVMYRMGGALRYRAFVTRHPANILIYVGPVSPRNEAEREKFRENLEKSGHKVNVAIGAESLAQALGGQPFDVIITMAGNVEDVSARIAQLQRAPTLIPVVPGNREEQALRDRYPRMVNEDANLNQFLKAIEQTMKSRGA